LRDPVVTVPDFYEVARTGLHYPLAVLVLIWGLLIEEMSPGLAAFWGVLAVAAVVLTQGPMTALFRGERDIGRSWRSGFRDFLGGRENGGCDLIAGGIGSARAGSGGG